MKNWGRRVRAGIWMGVTWGAAWAVGGMVLARVLHVDSDLPLPLLFAPLGFATGILFSGILVLIGRRRGFERMPLWHIAGWGSASGLLLSGVIVFGAALRGDALWGEFLLFGPPLALAGAASATGSMVLARWSKRSTLR